MSDSEDQEEEWEQESSTGRILPRVLAGIIVAIFLTILALAIGHQGARAHKVRAQQPAPALQPTAAPVSAVAVTRPPVPATSPSNEPAVQVVIGSGVTTTRRAGGGADVFGSLREASRGVARRATDWSAVAASLAKLSTLEGARVDPQTGQLLLYGTTGAQAGPFLIEDVLIALKAAFFELESPGMTLDENPNDKSGPWMLAKYFAGTHDTHFGQVMFECDRLMKCLSQGEDNITRQPLHAGLDKFRTYTELSVAMEEKSKGTVWTRFWANLATGRFPTNDVRGKSMVEVSADRRCIRFVDHRMFIDTEDMIDPGLGARLVSSGGVQSRSARAFADQLTANYDALAKKFTAFHALHELAKLAIVAEWIHDTEQPIDGELLHCSFDSHTATPTKTPSLYTTNTWRQGEKLVTVHCVGGVSLKPAIRYVQTKERMADSITTLAENHRSELRKGQVISEVSADGHVKCMIPFGPSARGPPEPGLKSRDAARSDEIHTPLRPLSRDAVDPVSESHVPSRIAAVDGQPRPLDHPAADLIPFGPSARGPPEPGLKSRDAARPDDIQNPLRPLSRDAVDPVSDGHAPSRTAAVDEQPRPLNLPAADMVPFGPSARGPPDAVSKSRSSASPDEMRSQLRPLSRDVADPMSGGYVPSRATEVHGHLRPMSRGAVDPIFGDHECPLFVVDADTGRKAPNFPVLRMDFSSRRVRSVRVKTSDNSVNCTVKIPERLYVTSPAQDIHIAFATTPEIDFQRREPYFPATMEGVSFYPNSRTLRLGNGDEFRFDSAGLIEDVTVPDKPHLQFKYKAYQDGPLARAPISPNTLPRGPPREIELKGGLRPLSRLAENPGAPMLTRCVISNARNGKTVEIRDNGAEVLYVYPAQ
jgi:hypothetical protein